MSLEDTFTSWAKGPGTTEQTKCENAESAVRKAIKAHEILSEMDITVFAQGSYRNRTNVRQDSDVDICVRLNSTFFTDYPPDTTNEDFGVVDSDVGFAEYKNTVQEALEAHFGQEAVTRGDKAFNIHENTYRIDADVVPTFEHRRYCVRDDNTHYYLCGIEFRTDAGIKIINWPNQHYDNGLEKHENTGRRFRKIIRILKRMRNKMQEEGIDAADNIASCMIESLVWNVPNEAFGHDTYQDDVRDVLAHLFNNTRTNAECSEWGEVSELKYLFCRGQPWTRDQAHNFISAAWDYVGFE